MTDKDGKDGKDDKDGKRGILGRARKLAESAIAKAVDKVKTTRARGAAAKAAKAAKAEKAEKAEKPAKVAKPAARATRARVRAPKPTATEPPAPDAGAAPAAVAPAEPAPAPQPPTASAAAPGAARPSHTEPFGLLDLEEPPETYGVDEVTVLARDPHTLFAYWEATPEGWARARATLGGDGALTLRLYAVLPRAEGGVHTVTEDHRLDWDHGRRYFLLAHAGAHVTAALGLLAPDGRFAPIAQAPRIRAPYAGPGPAGPVEWMEVTPARSRGARVEPPTAAAPRPGAVPAGRPLPHGAEAARAPSSGEMPASPWRWLAPTSPGRR